MIRFAECGEPQQEASQDVTYVRCNAYISSDGTEHRLPLRVEYCGSDFLGFDAAPPDVKRGRMLSAVQLALEGIISRDGPGSTMLHPQSPNIFTFRMTRAHFDADGNRSHLDRQGRPMAVPPH